MVEWDELLKLKKIGKEVMSIYLSEPTLSFQNKHEGDEGIILQQMGCCIIAFHLDP